MKTEAVQPDKEGGYWQVVEKRIDFLEGAQFAACLIPDFITFFKIFS